MPLVMVPFTRGPAIVLLGRMVTAKIKESKHWFFGSIKWEEGRHYRRGSRLE
jgi:hypothetical protein